MALSPRQRASRAEIEKYKSIALDSLPEEPLQNRETPLQDRETVRLVAAKLYGRGFGRNEIARALGKHLCPNSLARTPEQLLTTTRAKLRRWELSQEFRDLVYQHAVIELDMSMPGVIQAVSKRAKRGRVDAARLALELTGRHNPKGDTPPTTVVIQFGDIPRPSS